MTDHRALKALVRERISRTGESYTTAHRQVTSRAAEPGLRGLTPGYPAFGADAHGPSGLARHLLAQAGLEVSEALACGLGGGIGFLYAIFEYAQVPYPMLTIVGQHHPQPWFDAVTQHLGIPTTTVTSSRTGPALARLDSALELGHAAQLTVGRGHLPWHPGVRPEEAADPYTVVVAGKDGDEYLVDDCAAEPHRLPAQILAVAWAAHRKGRFGVTTLDREQWTPGEVDLAGGIRSAIRTTHAHLTGPVLGHAYDVNFGLSGLRRLATDLADTRSTKGWASRFATSHAFENGARRLAECLTWAHTSAGATRPLYMRFLQEAGPLAGLDLSAAVESARLAGNGWTELADLAAVSTTEDDPSEVIAAFSELVAQIVPVEERLARELGIAVDVASCT